MEITWFHSQNLVEIVPLLDFLAPRKLRTVLEIGSANGGTARMWAELVAPQEGIVYAIDLFNDPAYPGFTWWNDFEGKLLNVVPSAYHGTPFERFVHEIKGDSHDPAVIAQVRGLSVDFLFLDGDHHYEAVKTDFENYAPLVHPGGVIALHDILESEYGYKAGKEVYKLWPQLKQDKAYDCLEFVDPERAGGSDRQPMGIGVLIRK